MRRWRTVALSGLAAVALAGCATAGAPPSPERSTEAPETVSDLPASDAATVRTRHRLTLARADPTGRPLRLRCVFYRDRAKDPFAIHDAEQAADLSLEPGRYRVMIYARPLPFGFDILVTPDRPRIAVQIVSRHRAHLVVTETRRETVREGVLMVERQILGFGWGEPPVPRDQVDAVVQRARQERLREARRRAAAANATRRAAAQRPPPRSAESGAARAGRIGDVAP